VLPSLYSFISTNTPYDRKGGVMGIASSITMLGNLLGPISSGYIASVTSINFVFVLSGIVLGLGSLIVYKTFEEPAPELIHKEKIIESDLPVVVTYNNEIEEEKTQ
jgi:MFS family permease